jgi:hypothetical protein
MTMNMISAPGFIPRAHASRVASTSSCACTMQVPRNCSPLGFALSQNDIQYRMPDHRLSPSRWSGDRDATNRRAARAPSHRHLDQKTGIVQPRSPWPCGSKRVRAWAFFTVGRCVTIDRHRPSTRRDRPRSVHEEGSSSRQHLPMFIARCWQRERDHLSKMTR